MLVYRIIIKQRIKIIISLLFLVVFIGCDEAYEKVKIDMQASFESPDVFPSSGGSKSLTIESNTNKWNVSSSDSWLKVLNGDGKENGNVAIHADENKGFDPLDATITIRGTGFAEIVLPVKIAAATTFLEVTPTLFEFEASGGSKTIHVNSNISWKLNWFNSSYTMEYITFSPDQGTNNGTVTFTAKANTDAWDRFTEFMFTHADYENGKPETNLSTVFTVNQKGASPLLEVSESELIFPSSGGTKTFDIRSNTTWNVTSSASWIHISYVGGIYAGNIYVTVDHNATPYERTGSVITSEINREGDIGSHIRRTIQVTQSGH